MSAGRLGCIVTPRSGDRLPPDAPWCADNGCFGQGYPGDDEWVAWLGSFTSEQRERCRFAVAPDVLGDSMATLVRSLPWLAKIREMGYPAAFVAQDGLEKLVVPWDDFDVLFIGGTTNWKLGPGVRYLVFHAKARHKLVHMGRVNSAKRYGYAASLHCDSVDGTHIAFGPDSKLPQLLAWLRSVDQYAIPESLREFEGFAPSANASNKFDPEWVDGSPASL